MCESSTQWRMPRDQVRADCVQSQADVQTCEITRTAGVPWDLPLCTFAIRETVVLRPPQSSVVVLLFLREDVKESAYGAQAVLRLTVVGRVFVRHQGVSRIRRFVTAGGTATGAGSGSSSVTTPLNGTGSRFAACGRPRTTGAGPGAATGAEECSGVLVVNEGSIAARSAACR